jgi:hypothetical protein
VNELANRCRKESAKSPQHRDTRYCFEWAHIEVGGGLAQQRK